MKRYYTLLITILLTLAALAAPKQNVLTLKQTITDDDIVFPESFETDTHEMMQNWYLQNYTVLDADVENRSTGEVSEEEYIKRLRAIPSVIEMPYNQVVRSYIDRYVKRNRTLVEEMLGMSLYYMPIFEQALEKEQLPLELKYLPVIESALNPNAVSRAGAAGLWQFMVGTGKGLGLEVNSLVDERRDPYRSSEKAATYLKNLFSIYGDWSLAIAAYNCGPGNVNKALQRAGGEGKDFWDIYNYLPRETRGYVPAFIAANYIMTYFKRHNISPSLARKPLITDTVGVNRRIHFSQISHVLNMPIEEIRVLNPQYRHDVIPGDENHNYTLCLPSQQVFSYIMSEDSIATYRTDLYAHRDVVEPTNTTTVNSSDNRNYTWETKTVTQYHKVRRGENAAKIAARYGMTTKQLAQLNGLRHGKVQRGQTLKVTTHKRYKVYTNQSADNNEEMLADAGNRKSESDAEVTDDSNNEEESESEQIEEVQRVEREAAQAKLAAQTKKAEEKKATRSTTVSEPASDSKQWHSRNAKYADNRKSGNRETTYKNSRSSKRGAKHEEKPAKPVEHTIKKGESLDKIAKKAGVSVAELKKANGITGSGDKIKIGESLKIPAKGSTAATAKSSKSGKGGKAATSKSSSKSNKSKASSSSGSKKSSSKKGSSKRRK
ncbi:MAG: transglycosylase SLT domain-containing protein [Muribaculaceae bacterium]|nr:transglycosylase SLT domain-containing protein [Muribaculaceae bacterium]